MPQSDRWLIFDWTNRVIGYQDDEWSVSDAAAQSTANGRGRRWRTGPARTARGRVPSPWSRSGLSDLRYYAHELAGVKRRCPAGDIISILTARLDHSD
jgi:hypothetical protein